MEYFGYAFNAVTPMVLIIALGYFLKRTSFFTEDFLKKANKLVFRVALPLLLFCNVYSIQSFDSINWASVIYACAAVFLLFLLGIATAVLFTPDDRQKGVIIQCVFRSNYAIIGLSFAQGLGGDEATQAVAVIGAFTIPLFNILAVIAMTMFQKDENSSVHIKSTLKKIAANPLIIGCVIGLIVLLIRSFIPTDENGNLIFSIEKSLPFIYSPISNISKIASPLALLILGGQFDFGESGKMKKQLAIGTLWRIIIAPLIFISGAVLLSNKLSIGSAEIAAYIGLFGSPIAVSVATMAAEMENDDKLAGQFVVWTSIGSIPTVFFTVLLLKSTGIL